MTFPESADCLVCQGLGYVKLDVPIHDYRFGKAIPCQCRNEYLARQRASYLRDICRIPFRYTHVRWGGDSNHQDIAQAVRLSGQQQQFITLFGPAGTGKTHTLCAAVNEAVELSLVGVYVTMGELLNHLRKAYDPNSTVDVDKFWDTLIRADVLALDELDRWKPTQWAENKFFELINARYNANVGLTLTATNRIIRSGAGILEEQPGYLESRLFEDGNTVIPYTGRDRRKAAQAHH